MNPIEQDGGWWWPKSDKRARYIIPKEARDNIPTFLKHVRGRDLIVQAGGNIGIYPLALADVFQQVVTFEPDRLNYQCLVANLDARDALGRVHARQCALGSEAGRARMVEFEVGNCGAHKIEAGDGPVSVLTIDSRGLDYCDAIWLDIEGHELEALKGAAQTIAKFSPVIAFEDKGLGTSPCEWLESFGYSQIDHIGNDRVFRRTP